MTYDPSQPVDMAKALRINEVLDGLGVGNIAPAASYLWAHLRGEHQLDREIIVALARVLDGSAQNEDWRLKVALVRRNRGAPRRDVFADVRSAVVDLDAERITADHLRKSGARQRVLKKNVVADLAERHGSALMVGERTIRREISKKRSGSSS